MLDSPPVMKWLEQFEGVDRAYARMLVRPLKLVATSSVESFLTSQVTNLRRRQTGGMALIPIGSRHPDDPCPPKPRARDAFRDSSAPTRGDFSSVGRFAHLLERLSAGFGGGTRVVPTIEDMRTNKVRHYVLVDDIVGSGTGVIDHWRYNVPRSVKSWISYHKVALWLVVFTATPSGLNAITRRIKSLRESRIVVGSKETYSTAIDVDAMEQVLQKYRKKAGLVNGVSGYRGVSTGTVFQYGAPNTTPGLMVHGGPNWKALFPQRSIPTELLEYFGEGHIDSTEQYAEAIAEVGALSRALVVLNRDAYKSAGTDVVPTMTLLSLLRKQVRVSNLHRYVPWMSRREIANRLETLKKVGFLNEELKPTKYASKFFAEVASSVDEGFDGLNVLAPRMFVPAKFRVS